MPSIISYDTLPQPVSDFNLYAPNVFGGTMYLGGWLTAEDIGPDKLYTTPEGTDNPVPLVWSAAPPPQLALNDPSIVRLPDGTLVMFMTVLDQQYATGQAMFDHNLTGEAISYDNGASWSWQGIAVGQWNGLDNAGAWAPSAFSSQLGIVDVWYHTGAHDPATGLSNYSQVLRTIMTDDGVVMTTTPCTIAGTGNRLSLTNVDVKQAPDGTYWMVGNDLTGGYNLASYTSKDGNAWKSAFTIQGNGAMLLTPTILSVDATQLTMLYSEDLGHGGLTSHTVQHTATVSLQTQPYNFYVANVFNDTPSSGQAVSGNIYHGPVDGLQNEYIQVTANNLNINALTDNVFICAGPKDDALVAHGGYTVLDGQGGSNFMIAGDGRNTFFTHVDSGADTWSTVVGFVPGRDDLTLWDFAPAMGVSWVDSEGAQGYQGATFNVLDSQGNAASLTLTGYSVGQAQALTSNTGWIGGHSYLHFA